MTYSLSERRVCTLVEITRLSFRRPPSSDRSAELRKRLRAFGEKRRPWGCPWLYRMLPRDGLLVNQIETMQA